MRSSAGIATERSCIIIDALIYGWIESAKMFAVSNPPPDIILKKPKIVLS